MSEDTDGVIVNQLLAALPPEDYQHIAPHLENIYLMAGEVLCEPGETMREVYFPNLSMISLVSIMENGSTTEISLVGREGMVGLPVFLGGSSTISRAIVQMDGTAMKLNANILRKEFDRGGELQRLLLLYTQALFTQASQNAACNRQHNIEERLARWLLTAQDCIIKDELHLTQEFISHMLGTRRSGVTVAAGTLQQAGMIRYTRGRISILNRVALKATACECYDAIKNEYNRLLKFK
ncbi:Crp/Fnr family transcriptional regulator [Rivularia sp. UHCC 0363]|uniref:Crp/Fnr family transcriptional regulator n=1 Tax=Rivularia sp. UHCC 0363 TaxID=3110244 RepID=UPI002B221424|nr:Crp/Fnr family transcriptional regulator [Rivularia sp. UHCC 0363]MEA5595527.1 Crp/Fnr family transcriptional regulator [Rivularia sp. UHCC 0363]